MCQLVLYNPETRTYLIIKKKYESLETVTIATINNI